MRTPLKYRHLDADGVRECLDELRRQLVEEAPWGESPELDARIRALQAKLDRAAAAWAAGRLSVEAVEDRMREIRLASDMLDVAFDRRCAEEMMVRWGDVRAARRIRRQAERTRRRLWAERRAHEALVVMRPVRPRGRCHRRPRRVRASRDGPDCDGDGGDEGPGVVGLSAARGRWAA